MPGFATCTSWRRYDRQGNERLEMNKFEKHILEYIRTHEMARRGDLVLAALSGGPDSVCLLSVLVSLRKVLGIRLHAVHVHHGLRGAEADRDEAFCREMAARMDVPFDSIRVDVRTLVRERGLSEEEAARDLRYAAMQDLLQRLSCAGSEGLAGSEAPAVGKAPADNESPARTTGIKAGTVRGGHIAVAHHADDQAETILLNLLRGSGLKGLTGMQPVRGDVIRPLLETGRAEILRYLEEKGLASCLDRTNLDNDYTRNYLRNEILPRMQEGVNRRSSEHIAAAGRMIAQAEAFLEETARSLPGVIRIEVPARPEDEMRLPDTDVPQPVTKVPAQPAAAALQRRILKEKPQILRRYVIIEGLKQLGVPLKDWGEAHFSEIDEALAGHTGLHLDLPGGVCADNTREETILRRPGPAAETDYTTTSGEGRP